MGATGTGRGLGLFIASLLLLPSLVGAVYLPGPLPADAGSLVLSGHPLSGAPHYGVGIEALSGTALLQRCVIITLNGTAVTASANVTLGPGTYSLSAPLHVGTSAGSGCSQSYLFVDWTTTSNLTLANSTSNSTKLTVHGNGVVAAVYVAEPQCGCCAAATGISVRPQCVGPINPILTGGATTWVFLAVVVAVVVAAVLVAMTRTRRRKGSLPPPGSLPAPGTVVPTLPPPPR